MLVDMAHMLHGGKGAFDYEANGPTTMPDQIDWL